MSHATPDARPAGDAGDPATETVRSQPETGTLPARSRSAARRLRLRRILLLLGPLLVAVVAGYGYLVGGRYVGTENAYVKADMVMIAAQVSGPVVEVDVRENQRVAHGDVLFRVDDAPYRIALRESEAELANVANEIASLKASFAQKLEEEAMVRSDLAYSKREFERQSELLATKTTSRSKYDSARHDADVVRLRLRVLDQELAQIAAELGGDPGIAVSDHPRYHKAQTDIDRARLDLERTVVRAPFDGIASNTPKLGQQVAGNASLSSPVMSVVADSGAWIEANFKETDLTHVRPGQPVTVHVDTYPDRDWQGTVESISQATGAEFSVIPPQNATGNWVKVVQRIPVRIAIAADAGDPLLRAGMSTSVEIDTGHSRELPAFLQTALHWIGPSANAFAASPAVRK